MSPKQSSAKKKSITVGVVTIFVTFNNVIISITDTRGNVVVWSSSGKNGFKGSRRATPFAAQVTAEDAMTQAIALGLKTITRVNIKGVGSGRESAIRGIMKKSSDNSIAIDLVRDTTPVPHNGVKPPKKRRV